jgi:hypothetical protein
MFDVKTGLLMFTTRRAITAMQSTNQWNKQDKLDKLAAVATSKFAPDLAADVLADLRRFAAAAQAENMHRTGGAPDSLVRVPSLEGSRPTEGSTVATDSKP